MLSLLLVRTSCLFRKSADLSASGSCSGHTLLYVWTPSPFRDVRWSDREEQSVKSSVAPRFSTSAMRAAPASRRRRPVPFLVVKSPRHGRQIDPVSIGATLLRRRVAPRRLLSRAVDLRGEAHVRPFADEAWPTICGGTHREEVVDSSSWPRPEGPSNSSWRPKLPTVERLKHGRRALVD